ncbi:MAG TPA: transketolase [Polyangiaceae bacterium]|nr:transketolase [Polyangiaceae bacterium]
MSQGAEPALLARTALAIRREFLRMHFEAHAGHLGSGLSAIDILTYLYSAWLRPTDQFILSKGHGASALYATLHHFGKLSDAELGTYYQDGTLLPAHPAPLGLAAIPAATGSLGHGLPIATGMAHSYKYLHSVDARVACLISDGECDEGSTWEAALFAGHHRLNNLTVFVDANGIQGFGRTEEVLALEPFAKKWEAFGFEVSECNGHDFAALHAALSKPLSERPRCVIARTVKGKGVSFMENTVDWHYWPMSEAQYGQAIAELNQTESELSR